MPMLSIPGTSLTSCLIACDKEGRERTDDRDGRMMERAADAVRSTPVTDVFIASHGWKGDVPAAEEQYGRWFQTMLACTDDRARIRSRRAGFLPLIIGFHWPSLPFGDEELGPGSTAFGRGPSDVPDVEDLVEAYVERLGDTPAIRRVLRTILAASVAGPSPEKLPAEIRDAYFALDRVLSLPADGVAGSPGGDREPFDPDRAYESRAGVRRVAFGGSRSGDALLGPLRQLSFWKMKDRAREVGETGGAELLLTLQEAVPEGRDVLFHLMGHSFGCIVVSAMLKGGKERARSPRAVHSMALIQGALSLWSYACALPGDQETPGYFHDVMAAQKLTGPLVATMSRYDTAVGRLYPAAAGLSRQVAFGPGELPKYGAVGAFGVRSPGREVVDIAMKSLAMTYDLAASRVYNLESSAYICEGEGLSGAHSDIAKPEVAHAVWEAAMSS